MERAMTLMSSHRPMK
ncbi:unnamed protein product [Linum tenue]|uniref:Uncharacterized protein n=1 Tax=Linum tenue TaxID=586396 RepID=A0AAV0KDH4_9ROSI|nr:unnamed protein product [Linum tenue]